MLTRSEQMVRTALFAKTAESSICAKIRLHVLAHFGRRLLLGHHRVITEGSERVGQDHGCTTHATCVNTPCVKHIPMFI